MIPVQFPSGFFIPLVPSTDSTNSKVKESSAWIRDNIWGKNPVQVDVWRIDCKLIVKGLFTLWWKRGVFALGIINVGILLLHPWSPLVRGDEQPYRDPSVGYSVHEDHFLTCITMGPVRLFISCYLSFPCYTLLSFAKSVTWALTPTLKWTPVKFFLRFLEPILQNFFAI